MHNDAVCLLTHFAQRIQHRNSINIQLDKARAETARKNREALGPIVESVIFLGRHNLPFDGHRDDSKYHAEVGEQTSGKVGVLQSLLNFRVASGDKVLEEHLRISSRNAKYTSAPIQNEIIDACGKVITQKLAMRMKESGIFPVIADEATDISSKQQFALVIRYLDYILDALREGYDGGGNMVGSTKDAEALIKAMFPFALYFHCASHRLNLCVQKPVPFKWCKTPWIP